MTSSKTKVIIDFQPLVYAMYSSVGTLTTHSSFQALSYAAKEETLTSICEMNISLLTSLAFMGDKRPDEYQIIFVNDKKEDGKYWRHEYLAEYPVEKRQELMDARYTNTVSLITSERAKGVKGLRMPSKPKKAETIHYKGGRKQVTTLQLLLVTLMKRVIKNLGYIMVEVTGYEADDMASALVRLNDDASHIWLLTIDSDWLGMVGDNVFWACLYGFAPRFRDTMKALNSWSERRLKRTFTVARELWDYKAQVGDKSDNLPEMSPIEVIDLFAPPPEYDVLNQPKIRSRLRAILDDERDDAHFIFDDTTDKLKSIGLTPIVPLTA